MKKDMVYIPGGRRRARARWRRGGARAAATRAARAAPARRARAAPPRAARTRPAPPAPSAAAPAPPTALREPNTSLN